ncbi:hypothetical protein BT69DRAFT_1320928 [Atractiella rhizophila]|nr:hypothetical protein BT69DRAFT_1320928 [Atractiella rhizophila]
MNVPGDVKLFLDGYPGQRDDKKANANLRFYKNELRCRPDNKLIDEIHRDWKGAYDKLEYKHGFIQWLFPIREHGMNFESQPLMVHELEEMRSTPEIVDRVRRSYELMLDFYGMSLTCQKTGLLSRSSSSNQSSRYRNLVQSSHNNLRISRILKHLNEVTPLKPYAASFLLFVISEQSEHGTLKGRALMNSQERWWNNCLMDAAEREFVNKLYKEAIKEDKFTFTSETYKEIIDRREKIGKLSLKDEDEDEELKPEKREREEEEGDEVNKYKKAKVSTVDESHASGGDEKVINGVDVKTEAT